MDVDVTPGHAVWVFQFPSISSGSGRFYLQCGRLAIAGWGIITRAIKEQFTGRPASGVSMVPHPEHCTVLGHQAKAQNTESQPGGECDDLNMKVTVAAALVAFPLWLVSPMLRREMKCHLMLYIINIFICI